MSEKQKMTFEEFKNSPIQKIFNEFQKEHFCRNGDLLGSITLAIHLGQLTAFLEEHDYTIVKVESPKQENSEVK